MTICTSEGFPQLCSQEGSWGNGGVCQMRGRVKKDLAFRIRGTGTPESKSNRLKRISLGGCNQGGATSSALRGRLKCESRSGNLALGSNNERSVHQPYIEISLWWVREQFVSTGYRGDLTHIERRHLAEPRLSNKQNWG